MNLSLNSSIHHCIHQSFYPPIMHPSTNLYIHSIIYQPINPLIHAFMFASIISSHPACIHHSNIAFIHHSFHPSTNQPIHLFIHPSYTSIHNSMPPCMHSSLHHCIISSIHVLLSQLIQSDLDDDDDERIGVGGRGTLRFKHKLPIELRGPDGVHAVHGSTGTLLTSDLNSLPEDDQRALARSLEALHADGGLYGERNARTESAKSTPLHRNKGSDTLPEIPLEITEL